MKIWFTLLLLFPIQLMQASSTFNDVLSARLAGNDSPVSISAPSISFSEVEEGALSEDWLALFDTKSNYSERAAIAGSFDLSRFSDVEWNALLAWLSHSPKMQANAFAELSELSLKNDLLLRAIESGIDNERMGQLMLLVVLDTEQSPLWREYVLQHFVNFYEITWLDAEADYLTELRNAFQAILANCLFENSALCGTSVINLIALCQSCPEFDDSLILQCAELIASDPNQRVDSRVTALQLLGELGQINATQIATSVLLENDPKAHVSVQRAALGTLKSTKDHWHSGVIADLEQFLVISTHGRLRRLAKELLNS